jgi:hypothetical protein
MGVIDTCGASRDDPDTDTNAKPIQTDHPDRGRVVLNSASSCTSINNDQPWFAGYSMCPTKWHLNWSDW